MTLRIDWPPEVKDFNGSQKDYVYTSPKLNLEPIEKFEKSIEHKHLDLYQGLD